MIIIGIIFAAVFFMPVYFPFLLSFLFQSKDWRELKWSLRISSLACLCVAMVPPPGLRHDFGDDVGGNIAGAQHNFPITLKWVWGGGLGCILAALVIGLLLRSFRHRCELFQKRSTPLPTED